MLPLPVYGGHALTASVIRVPLAGHGGTLSLPIGIEEDSLIQGKDRYVFLRRHFNSYPHIHGLLLCRCKGCCVPSVLLTPVLFCTSPRFRYVKTNLPNNRRTNQKLTIPEKVMLSLIWKTVRYKEKQCA
jgi:hypothetical protein